MKTLDLVLTLRTLENKPHTKPSTHRLRTYLCQRLRRELLQRAERALKSIS